MSTDTQQLIQQSLQGDQRAFGQIVERYQGAVSAMAYSVTGNIAQSEDLAQEAFIIAWKKLGALQKHESLSAWLCGITRNLARDWMRTQAARPTISMENLDETVQPLGESSEATRQRRERADLVWTALAEIPENYREPLILFYRQGESIRDIAEALELSEDNVKQRLSRGRKLLRAEVARTVEDTLADTRPGKAFTAGVIALLPMLAAKDALAVSGSSALTAKGTAAGSVTFVHALPLLAALAGAMAGLFATWDIVRNTPTLAVRRYTLRAIGWCYAAVWLFFGMHALALHIEGPLRGGIIGGGWMLYWAGGTVAAIIVNRRVHGMVQRAFANGGIDPAADLPELRVVRRTLQWGLAVGIVGSLLLILSVVHGRTVNAGDALMVGMIVLCHYGYHLLGRKGLAISADQAAFDAKPPIPSRSLSAMAGAKLPPDDGLLRGSIVPVIATLAVLGPFTPIGIAFVMQGVPGMGVAYTVVVVVSAGIVFLLRHSRQRQLSLSNNILLVTGAVDAVLIEYGYWPQSGPQWHLHLIALIYLSAFWSYALSAHLQLRRWRS